MSKLKLRLAVSAGLLVLVASSATQADWPMHRHDPQRTGTTPDHADLADAAVSLAVEPALRMPD